MAGIQDPAVFAGVSEKELQSAIVEAMGYMGWRTYHTHDSRRSNPGFPDVVGVKGSRLIFLELKSEKGKTPKWSHPVHIPYRMVWLLELLQHG